MKINEDKRIIKASHNGIDFVYDDGVLDFLGIKWSRKKIKNLVAIANLLELEGFKLKEELEVEETKGTSITFGFYGV